MDTVRQRGHELWDAVFARIGKRRLVAATVSIGITLAYGVLKLVAGNEAANAVDTFVLMSFSWLWRLQAGPLLVVVAGWIIFVVLAAAIESSPIVKKSIEKRRDPTLAQIEGKI